VDARVTVSTPIEKTIGPYIVEDNPIRKVAKTFYFNSSSSPSGATGLIQGSNFLSTSFENIRYNEFGKYDYVKVDTIEKGQSGGSYFLYGPIFTEVSSSTTYDVVDKEKTITTLYQRYKWKYTHSISFHPDLGTAISAISGGETGSGYSEAGYGVFRSDKVSTYKEYVNQSSSSVTYPWNPPEGYS
jgi:hypothetical protein